MAPLSARGQFATLLDTTSRYAGNSTGTSPFNGDTGVATATSLNVPSNVAFDSLGNLYISDTQNNCVRKVDSTGHITTVAGYRASGQPDTCNTSTNPAPTAAEGLLQPTGLAIDSNNTLYIADSQHNCVRSLASGVVDSFASPALTTVAGTCSSVHTGSHTPLPDGLAVDSNSNLYISIVDSLYANAINQVVRHLATDPATTICVVAGQHSTDVPTALCTGITSTVTLDRPAGLVLDKNGNLFIADSSNNCVREIAGLTTPQTAVGQCVNDLSGSAATPLNNPYGLAFSANGSLYISESGSGHNNVVSFNFGTNALTPIAGLPSGASGAYNASQDGQSALSVPLSQPLGITTDTGGNIFLADSQNNIVRRMGTNLSFPNTIVNQTSPTQTVVFSINQTVNLTLTAGTDFNIVSTTCSGSLTHSANPTCQVALTFSPSRPGFRYSALQLKDSISGKLIRVELEGLGVGPLSLLAPGVASTRASALRTAIAVTTDSAGDSYVLEQGNGSSTADVLFYPAGGGPAQVVVAQGAGMVSPSAMAVDGAGNIFIADSAVSGGLGGGNIIRFGADGSVNTSYATGLPGVNSMAVDGFDDLFLAIGGSFHNVTEIYAGGQHRIVAGNGTVADANNVPASRAVFSAPSAVALGPNGLAIADAGTHFVYLVDNSGIIHIVAGNGTTTTTSPGVATGTGLLTPDGLAIDAAGDIYIADSSANTVYAVYSVISNGSNIYPVIGTGTAGYTGDGGPSTAATINAPLAIALDGSSDLFVIDSANNALREVSYPVTSTIGFGSVLIGSTSNPVLQFLANAGNASLAFSLYPFTTTDSHYAVLLSATTCTAAVVSGGVCDIAYTYTPTPPPGAAPAGQSNLISNSYNSQQTVIFSTSGSSGYSTTPLPFTLLPETEVYGYSFSETFTFSGSSPASGTMVFYTGSQTLCTATITNASAGTITCNAPPSGLTVGSYSVNFTFTSTNSFYSSVTGTTTLNVTKAPLTVNINSFTRPYGTPNPTFTGTVIGLVNSDVINVTYSTTATVSSPVGSYIINAVVTGVNISNYNVAINTGTLIITQSTTPLVITVNNATRPYGTPNPTFTSTVTGEAPGDSFTLSYSTAATITSYVGAYPITASITGGSSLSNYTTIQVVSGTLAITPATTALVVQVDSTSRPYGIPNPTFTGRIVSGLLNGDNVTLSFSTLATILSPIGNYAITASISGPAAANYTVTVVQGTLTITPSTTPLVITINSTSRQYGVANPAFTSTVSGALNGDNFTLNYSTAAVLTSPLGLYPINASISGGSSISNYSTVTILPGTLAITQAPTVTTVTTSATPVAPGTNVTFTAAVTYGTSLPVTAATVNFYNGTTLLCASTLSSSGVATCTTSTLPVGTLTITATYQTTLNFASSSGTVAQVVNPGSFTLSATPPNQFISGPGTTVYLVTVTSVQGFAGPVALACSGLPADATCTFATPAVNLTGTGDGASGTTTMTVTTTMADARLNLPSLHTPTGRTPSGLSPIAFAAVFPFGLVAFFGLSRRKRGRARASSSPRFRLLFALLCTAAIISLAGCACLSSVNQVYTIPIAGTTTVSGVGAQSTSVTLTVAQE